MIDLPTGRKRVGLALSGAVARGFTHIGVIEVLEREGIPIDVVAGTSAGSIMGSLYCYGVPVADMKQLIKRLGWGRLVSLVWPREGFVSFIKLEKWLDGLLKGARFEDLKKPLACVATDLEKGEPVTLKEGRVAHAVHASCAVPGFVVPVHEGGRTLCDGGASSNIPAQAARELGADYVIGVDLFAHQIRRGWGPFGLGIAAVESLVRNSGAGRTSVDCLITPELAGSSYLSMKDPERRIALGIKAAEAALPKIREALELPAAGSQPQLARSQTEEVEVRTEEYEIRSVGESVNG